MAPRVVGAVVALAVSRVAALSALENFRVDGLELLEGRVREDGLQKWLASITFNIPSAAIKKNGFDVFIKSGSCGKVGLGGIVSSRSGHSTLHVMAMGVRASCNLTLDVRSALLPGIGYSGEILATVAESSIGSDVALVSDGGNPALPYDLTAKCIGDIKISSLDFKGSFEAKIIEPFRGVITGLLNLLLTSVIVCPQLDALVKKKVVPLLQIASKSWRHFLENDSAVPSGSPFVPVLSGSDDDLADLAGNPGTQMLRSLFADVLTNPKSNNNLNAIFSKFMDGGVASLSTLGLLPFTHAFEIASLGEVNVTVSAFNISGLNTWSDLSLQSPAKRSLAFRLALAKLAVSTSVEVNVSVNNSGPLHGSTAAFPFDLALSLGGVAASSAWELFLNQSYLGKLTIEQLASPGCLAHGILAAFESGAGLNIKSIQPNVTPTGETGLEENVDSLINLIAEAVLTPYIGVVNATGNALVHGKLRNLVNSKIAELLTGQCVDAMPTYTSHAASNLAAYTSMTFLASVAIALAIGQLTRLCGKYRFAGRAVEPAPVASPLTDVEAASTALEQCCWGDCLALHPRMPRAVTYMVPLIVMADILAFVAANLSVGVNIMATLHANGQDIVRLPPIKQYSLVSSFKDMWDGQVYPLALLILFFSGIWPYMKLLAMLICWFTPIRKMSVVTRQKLLELLDALGKWSLVDSFVMVLFMVAFELRLSVDKNAPWQVIDMFREIDATAELRVYVEPLFSFYCFLVATIGSLILGHVMTACHRYALQIGEFGEAEGYGESGEERRRLCNVLRPEGYAQGKVFALGPMFTLVISLLLVLFGICLHTFQFRFQGLTALILGPEDSVRPYSVLSLSAEVPDSNPRPDSFGIRSIQFTFLLFVAAVVVAYHIVLIVLWCAPLKNRVQRHLLVTAYVLNAWSALDVFVVGIMASVLEIEQFVSFVIGDKCDGLDAVLSMTPLKNMIPGDHVTCFDVKSQLCDGFFVLAAAAVISSVVGHIVLTRCATSLCTASRQPRLQCRAHQ